MPGAMKRFFGHGDTISPDLRSRAETDESYKQT